MGSKCIPYGYMEPLAKLRNKQLSFLLENHHTWLLIVREMIFLRFPTYRLDFGLTGFKDGLNSKADCPRDRPLIGLHLANA